MSPNLFKKSLLSKSRCVAGPELWSKLIQHEASSLLGPPFRPELRRRLPLGFSWAALGLLLAAPGLLLAAPGLLLAPPGLLLTHTSIRTSHLEGSRAGRCILRRRDCWVWVVPCTGSWPGQPPPRSGGRSPNRSVSP